MREGEPETLADDAPEAIEPDAKDTVRSFARRGRPPGSTNKYEIRLLRNYWPADGSGKTKAGEVITVGKDEARAMIACGIGERADPLDL